MKRSCIFLHISKIHIFIIVIEDCAFGKDIKIKTVLSLTYNEAINMELGTITLAKPDRITLFFTLNKSQLMIELSLKCYKIKFLLLLKLGDVFNTLLSKRRKYISHSTIKDIANFSEREALFCSFRKFPWNIQDSLLNIQDSFNIECP